MAFHELPKATTDFFPESEPVGGDVAKVSSGISVEAAPEEEHWASFCTAEEVLGGKKVGAAISCKGTI